MPRFGGGREQYLVNKEQLWRDVSTAIVVCHCIFRVVFLERHVPRCDLVIGARDCENRIFGRMPFHGGDRGLVPIEVRCGFVPVK